MTMERLLSWLVSGISYQTCGVCLVSVPLTHALGCWLHCPKRLRPWRYLLYPFSGGTKHVVLQLLSWLLWSFSILALLPVYLTFLPGVAPKQLPLIPRTHLDVVSGAAAVVSFVAELFMLKALLVYEGSGGGGNGKDGGSSGRAARGGGGGGGAREWLKPRPRLASAAVAVMGGMLTLTSVLLLMALDYMPDIPSRVLYCCLSLSCLLIAVSSTYGLGGFLRYQHDARRRRRARAAARADGAPAAPAGAPSGRHGSPRRARSPRRRGGRRGRSPGVAGGGDGSSDDGSSIGGAAAAGPGGEGAEVGWQFFQPFSGGTAFVAAQAIGWSLFAAAIVLVIIMLQQLVRGVASCVRCWAVGAGSVMVAAQAALAISIVLFRQSTACMIGRAASHTLGLSRLAPPPRGAGAGAAAAPAAGALPAPPPRKPGPPPLARLRDWVGVNMPIILMYTPVHVFFTLWVVSFTFFPVNFTAAVWVAFLVPYYALSSVGDFPHTGCREWPWLLRWFSHNVERSVAHWFGSVLVVYDGSESDRKAHSKCAAPPVAVRIEDPRRRAGGLGGKEGGRGEACASEERGGDGRLSGSVSSGSLSSAGGRSPSPPAPAARAAGGGGLRRRLGERQIEHAMLCGGGGGGESGADTAGGQGAAAAAASSPANAAAPAAGASPASPGRRMIFGFHPHGFYPTGAGFLPMMSSFRRKLPGVSPSTLVASALFVPPFLRDIGAWSGFRKVTRHTFLNALHERGSVVLCPGGQAEMCHTHRMYRLGPGKGARPELVLHARHKGFCKIAIEQGAALVPVLALGEALQLRNLVHMPALQAYTTRRFRFPFPFWLGGRWGVSPLPSAVPLVYVIGEPLPPPGAPRGAAGAEGAVTPVSPGDVDALHAAYFDSLVDLFRRYRHLHPHFKDADLVLAYD